MAQAEQEQAVVRRGAGRAADAAQTGGALRLKHGPVPGLLGPHRPAIDQGRNLHPEHLLQQAPLGPHVVGMADGPMALLQSEAAVGGAAGAAVAELTDQHHAPAPRVEHRPHRPVDVLRPGAVGTGVEHQIGALWIGSAVDAVIQSGVRQNGPGGKGEVAERKGVDRGGNGRGGGGGGGCGGGAVAHRAGAGRARAPRSATNRRCTAR